MKKIIIISCSLIIIIILIIVLNWKSIVYFRLNSINLPENCETYEINVNLNHFHLYHTIGSKVIKSDSGLNYVKKYIEENNSKLTLSNIRVKDFFTEREYAMFEYEEKIPVSERNKYIEIEFYLY